MSDPSTGANQVPAGFDLTPNNSGVDADVPLDRHRSHPFVGYLRATLAPLATDLNGIHAPMNYLDSDLDEIGTPRIVDPDLEDSRQEQPLFVAVGHEVVMARPQSRHSETVRVLHAPYVKTMLSHCQLGVSLRQEEGTSQSGSAGVPCPLMTSKELLLLAQANAWAADGTARRLRVSSGLTLDLVGQFCGVTGVCISHWEKVHQAATWPPGAPVGQAPPRPRRPAVEGGGVVIVPDPAEVPTVSIEEAAPWYGLGRSSVYEAARRGQIPTIRVGRKVRVPVAAARRQLGLDPATAPAPDQADRPDVGFLGVVCGDSSLVRHVRRRP